MIELKNVSKTYKSKKATNTTALKNISIKFPEKGLVFILGKSGSGKSTLLNVIGGLDKYDEGEVIINGKSTIEFKEKDFDAFRNTYMGFIFQEYNLLENYSIEQNIKLPLELQHIKATDEEVKNALKQVDLENISKRKTNELSGGQKQRVAIARALIKNPEIILADEPTGNLDTETSEQIWNILKNLSKDKLIIVVSHDAESAQKYADRIIQIKDGSIISDNGNNDTTNTQKYNLVKARLPFFYSFKMGVGSLGHKKLKLIFSTLLIVFSLICFGVMLSAYKSDLNTRILSLFEENGPTNVDISKYKNEINYLELRKKIESSGSQEYEELMEKYSPIDIDEGFINEVKNKTGMTWNNVYKIDSPSGNAEMIYPDNNQNIDNMPMYYWFAMYALNDLSFMETDNLKLNNVIGEIPKKDDEIMIPSFIADCIIYRGCLAKDTNDEKAEIKKYQPKNYNDLVNSGKFVNISNIAYMKIVGIIDYSDRLNQFSTMKTTKSKEYGSAEDSSNLFMKLNEEITYNQTTLYVHSSFINKMKNEKNTYSFIKTKLKYGENKYISQGIAYIDKEIVICTNEQSKKITNLNSDEIVINEGTLSLITDYNYSEAYENNKNKYDSKEDFLIKYLKDNSIIGKNIKININNGKLVENEQEYVEYKIVGVYFDEISESENSNSIIYYSKNIVEPLISGKVHCKALSRKVEKIDEMKKILSQYSADLSYELSSCIYSDKALEASSVTYFLTFISKYGVVFFLLFASMILMNFINSSIKFRKKEIGTLRALGCRSIDIIKMFLYESIILMVISLGISFAIIPKIINTVNTYAMNSMFINIKILEFGSEQVLEITGIMLIIVVLANVFPVRRITKMKPIDAILNK